MKTDIKNKENFNLEQLLSGLKKEDKRYAKISRSFQIIYFILAPLYLAMALFHFFDEGSFLLLISGIAFAIGMIIFAFLFRGYYKEYMFVDYSLPTIIMLKKAAYRYKPFQRKTIWAFAAIIFMDLGLTFREPFADHLLKVQIFFLGSIFLATIVGLIVWYYKYKPLRDGALALIAEIEGE